MQNSTIKIIKEIIATVTGIALMNGVSAQTIGQAIDLKQSGLIISAAPATNIAGLTQGKPMLLLQIANPSQRFSSDYRANFGLCAMDSQAIKQLGYTFVVVADSTMIPVPYPFAQVTSMYANNYQLAVNNVLVKNRVAQTGFYLLASDGIVKKFYPSVPSASSLAGCAALEADEIKQQI